MISIKNRTLLIVFIVIAIIAFILGVLIPSVASRNTGLGLVDPKPKLPPMEKNRVYHPKGFSIIVPIDWKFRVDTTEKNKLNRICIWPDIDARWSPKLEVRMFKGNEDFYYTQNPDNYHMDRYLSFDAKIYEGLWHDYYGWHAVFSYRGNNYGVVLILPHGHGPPRYEKIPDYWWPFLNSFRCK